MPEPTMPMSRASVVSAAVEQALSAGVTQRPRRLRRPLLLLLILSPLLLLSLFCGLGTFVWIAATRAVHPAFQDDLSALALYPFAAATQNIHFPSLDGAPLAGWYIPSGQPGSATVILLEGYGEGRAAMLPQANYLHQAGYNVLLFDYRGTGQSGGSAFTFGIKEPLDVRGAVAYLLTHHDGDPSRIAVQGVSIGGAIALMAMAEDAHISAAVAESSFPSLKGMIGQNFTRYTRLPLFPLGNFTIWLMERRLGGNVASTSPIRAITKLQGRPVFIIDDLNDKVIPPDSGRRLYAAASDPKELWLVRGTAHANGFLVWPKLYAQHVLQFYSQYLGIERAGLSEHVPSTAGKVPA